ncbi:hypothetical protein B4N89_32715 [Embleya scabrispora]|uniref:HEAT repeat domain-containing protein n=1 Tax=Embleya scabrispora TaxID=159449 RepID=A0A1T3NQ02_9ACTN|nr:hypothetical protein B4N89_32715 [Embleya scabrispora]
MTTYYWDSTPLADPETAAARDTLVRHSRGPEFTDAFLKLLRSGQRVPVAIALARYQYSEAESRWGSDNPAESVSAEVLDRARALLSYPPMKAFESGATRDEADHASALSAMMNLADVRDADLIANVIERSSEPEVLAAASMAAHRPFELAEVPNPRLVEAIGRRATDESLGPDIRAEVLRALGYAHCARGLEIALGLAESCDVTLQVAAAQVLAAAHLATHRDVVERLRASWPEGTIDVGNVDILLQW